MNFRPRLRSHVLIGAQMRFFEGGLAQDSNLRIATYMGGKRLRSDFVSYYLMTQLVKESFNQNLCLVVYLSILSSLELSNAYLSSHLILLGRLLP